MAEYLAKIKTGNKLVETAIIADSKGEAERLAARKGRVVGVKKVSSLGNLFIAGLTAAERIMFLRRLSTMVRSRVGMGDSLKIMREAFKGSISRAADELYRNIESGVDFGDAIMTMPRDFPKTTAALIRAGIKGGDMYQALEDAAQFEAEMDRIKRDSSRGLLAAMGSFMLAAGTIIVTAQYVGPYVMESDLIKAAGDSVDVQWVFTAADVTGYLMIGIVLFFLVLLGLAYGLKPMAPSLADKIILKIPVYRELVLAQTHYSVFYGMGLLVRSGVRIEDTLRLSYETAPPGEVAEDLHRALVAVRKGRPWPMAMQNLHPTDRAALGTSQDREQISDSLDAVAQQHKENYGYRVQQVIPVLQMMSALFMSIGGGLIFGMVILPMLQMTKGIL